MREAVQAGLAAHKIKEDLRLAENLEMRNLFSALPDGTPLVVRVDHGRHWQLGLKKGRVDATMARNAMIAPLEVLRGDEIRAAGLSMHHILPLVAAADKAIRDHPEATGFLTDKKTLLKRCKLHPGQPWHKSLLPNLTKQKPAAWMQTTIPYSLSGSFEVHDDHSPNFRSKESSYTRPNMPRVRKDEHCVTLIEKRRWNNIPPAPERFGRIASLWVLDSDIAEVMQSFNLGDASFAPISLIDFEDKIIPGDRVYLAVDTPVSAVIPHLCDPDILRMSGGRTVQSFEVHIDTNIAKDLDLWWDDTIRNGTLFFSERLRKALMQIKAFPRIAAKPCAGA